MALKMKFNISPEFIFVVIVFLLIVFVSNYGSTKIVSYSAVSKKLPMFPYQEGATDMEAAEKKKQDDTIAIGKFFTEKPDTTPLEGFESLKGSVYGQNKPLDPIGALSSSSDCVGSSAGLTNTTGGICLTPEVKQLLHTRGQNSSGQPMQIGA
jgi:hypothetical protein